MNYQSANPIELPHYRTQVFGLFMNQNIKFPQIVPVYNAKPDKVAAAADSQFLTNSPLVIFNAFTLNDEAGRYFGGGKAISYERQNVPLPIG